MAPNKNEGAADTVPDGNRNRKRCSVSGCDKQSQGARNNGMCRFHFKEWAAQNPDLAKDIHLKAVASAAAASVAGAELKVDGGGQRRTLCKIDGCPKQSQGSRCSKMCAAHYNEAVKAGVVDAGSVLPSIGGDGKLSTGAANPTGAANSTVAAKATSGAKRKSTHAACKVEGCTKQSQGARCNLMCARHFKELSGGTVNGDGKRKRSRAPAASGRPHKVRQNPKGGNHPLCQVEGCPKLSQGGRCNFMCAAHHKEHNKTDVTTTAV